MSGKQIGGIILIIAGTIIGGFGLINVVDLASLDLDNPIIKIGIALSGTSVSGLWIKYGTMLAVGVLGLVSGILMLKNPISVVAKGE